jgi:uncharacterized protein
MIMDVYYPPGAEKSLSSYQELSGCPVHPIMRLDNIVDSMIAEGGSASEICSRVQVSMQEGARTGIVGFKSILAYRTGLAVNPDVSVEEANDSLASRLPLHARGKGL